MDPKFTKADVGKYVSVRVQIVGVEPLVLRVKFGNAWLYCKGRMDFYPETEDIVDGPKINFG